MKLKIEGVTDGRNTTEIERAITFFASRLLTEEETKKLSIHLVCQSEDGCQGMTGRISANSFFISFEPRDRYSVIETLAHEMVHVKQFVRSELVEALRAKRTKLYWKGSEFFPEDEDYFDLPWEIEAFGRQVGLMHHYMNSINEWLATENIS